MRVANPIAENTSYFASSREFEIQDSLGVKWLGIMVLTSRIVLNFLKEKHHSMQMHTEQILKIKCCRYRRPTKLRFYNLDGESYSNSIQFDFNYELFDRFDVKLAYKINQVYSTYDGEKMLAPLVPENRALVNFAYSTTHSNKWMFDATWNYIGESKFHTTLSLKTIKRFQIHSM